MNEDRNTGSDTKAVMLRTTLFPQPSPTETYGGHCFTAGREERHDDASPSPDTSRCSCFLSQDVFGVREIREVAQLNEEKT